MKIQMDVDGVLADFNAGFYRLAQGYDPGIQVVLNNDQKDWHTWEGISKEIQEKCWSEIKSDPLFWYRLPSLATREEFRMLRNLMIPSNEIYFVTSRPGETSKWQTEAWLFDRLEMQATVIVTAEKGGFAKLIEPDWSLEDRDMNAYKIGREIGANRSFIIDRPYNRSLHHMSARRVKTVKEFLQAILLEDN